MSKKPSLVVISLGTEFDPKSSSDRVVYHAQALEVLSNAMELTTPAEVLTSIAMAVVDGVTDQGDSEKEVNAKFYAFMQLCWQEFRARETALQILDAEKKFGVMTTGAVH